MEFDDKKSRDSIEAAIRELESKGNPNEQNVITMMRNTLSRNGDSVIKPRELYRACVAALFSNKQVDTQDYAAILLYAQKVYSSMMPYAEATKDFDERAEIFYGMFMGSGFIAKRCFEVKIMNLFYSIKNYRKWAECMAEYHRFRDVVEFALRYGAETRCYFTEEETFTANYIYVCSLMIDTGDPEAIYRYQRKKVEHMVGIYEVDEAMIREAEQSMKAAKDTIDRSKDILQLLEERMKTVDSTTEHAVDRIKQITNSEVELAQAKVSGIEAKLQEAYDKFADTQREKVLFEKKQLVAEVVNESDAKLEDFRQNVRSIINMAKLEISKLNQESGDVLRKIDSYVKDDAKIKGLLKSGAEQEKVLSKLEKLTILNDNNLELLNSRLETEAKLLAEKMTAENQTVNVQNAGAAGGNASAGASKKSSDKQGKGQKNAVNAVGANTVIQAVLAPNAADQGLEVIDNEEIPPVNYLLDESISFRERYEFVQQAKKEMEQKGEHFHKMFDDVLTAVMENANPYLIGPSGCGKTYMVNQLCKLLNTSFIDIGYINEEYDILGFQTANGGYSRPNFYRCYKYGKIAFCDELDNGNSRATVKLNSFLSNTKGAGYNFPNGEHVKRHGNFRIIAAGNTAGNGADSVYNTREKIEESVQQRFMPIYVGYDNEIERAILKEYSDWFEFVVMFREATNAWSKKSHCVASGIITTRDTARIKRYLDNKSFDMNRILDYEFIQTKDEGYLAFLAEYVKQNVQGKSPCKNIANAFIKKVDEIRKGDTERY